MFAFNVWAQLCTATVVVYVREHPVWKFLKQLLLDPIRSVLQYEIRCVYIIYAQSSIRFQEERQYVNEG